MRRHDPDACRTPGSAWRDAFFMERSAAAAALRAIAATGTTGGIAIRNILSPARRIAAIPLAYPAGSDVGEVGEGHGLAYDIPSAAFCAAA